MDNQYIQLFNEIKPGFFESEGIRSLPKEMVCDEMILPLSRFTERVYQKDFGKEVTFGYYPKPDAALLEAVREVVPVWPALFDGESRIYYARVDGQIASFCMIEDFGEYDLGGRRVKVGGPGCVGTVPAYRNRGVGLCMVRNVTRILKDEGFDISYIHFTEVAGWYEKLGYKTVLTWNRDGIISASKEDILGKAVITQNDLFKLRV